MAVAAEVLEFTPAYIPESMEDPASYISLDQVPELQFVRRRARMEARSIYEQNMQHLRDGNFEAVNMPVDPLGTARRAMEAAQQHGYDSPQHRVLLEGLLLDCRRLYAEAARKNTYEYFQPSRQEFRPEAGAYFSYGQSILEMTGLGISPLAEPEECQRRINERVEEATYCAIGRLGLSDTVKVMTVSECTDWAIAAYKKNQKGNFGGYVPENEKLMVRDVIFDPVTGDRFEEGVGLPGVHYKRAVITEALRRRGLTRSMPKTELHGTQILHEDDLFDFIALLDTVAGEFTGECIFMGEVVEPRHPKDYSVIRNEAVARQRQLEHEAVDLAQYVLELETNKVDPWLAVSVVEQRVKQRLLNIARHDISQAGYIFDEQTKEGLQEVAYLELDGRADEARVRFAEVERQAPPPGYCGAGSCGLEAINQTSEEGRVLARHLKAESSDTIVKDTERACKCGKKGIVYAYNQTKVNKYCQHCGAFESKVSKAA